MIDLPIFLTFVFAVTILMAIPGPNVALVVANSVAHGTRYGLLTVAGTSSAMIVQLGLTSLGMTGLLGTLGMWFGWVRWFGVAHLIYLGVRLWRTPAANLAGITPEPKSARAIYMRALLVSLTNPKTLLFYGAFFPQFVSPAGNVGSQVALLSITFLMLAILMDGTWAVIAGRARAFLASRARLGNRIGGGLLIAAGAGLALARNK